MAFQDLETSVEDGRIVVFYQFTFGSTIWRYTSADRDLLVLGNLWKAAAISDDGVRQTGEATADALTIEAPAWIGPSNLFMSGAPSKTIEVAILEKHESNADVVVIYTGEISQVNYQNPGRVTIICETLSASLAREGLRLGWQRSCPYALYDPLTCKVSKASFGYAVTVTAVSTKRLTLSGIAAEPDYKFSNGFMKWTHPLRGVEYIAIDESYLGGIVEVAGSIGDIFEGAAGTIYPGCNFTPEDCTDKFSNYDNYGGAPLMPGKSPFDGNQVF